MNGIEKFTLQKYAIVGALLSLSFLLVVFPSVELWLLSKFREKNKQNKLLPIWISHLSKQEDVLVLNALRKTILENKENAPLYKDFQQVLKRVNFWTLCNTYLLIISLSFFWFLFVKTTIYIHLVFIIVISVSCMRLWIGIYFWEEVKMSRYEHPTMYYNIFKSALMLKQRKDYLSLLSFLDSLITYSVLIFVFILIANSAGYVKIKLLH